MASARRGPTLAVALCALFTGVASGCDGPAETGSTGTSGGGTTSHGGSGGGGSGATGGAGGSGATAGSSGSGASGGSGGSGASGGSGGSCDPGTCLDAGAVCGAVLTGCGSMLECGECYPGQSCLDNACVVPGCSGEWSYSKPQTGGFWYAGAALDIGEDGRVVLAGAGWFAERAPGGAWATTPLPGTDWDIDVDLAPSGAVHVSSFTTVVQSISVFSRAPGAATFTESLVDTVDEDQYQDTTSVFEDSEGNTHVRYLKNDTLQHAVRMNGSATWQISTAAPAAVHSGSDPTSSKSLAVDASGGVHIAYMSSWDNVAYAYKPPGGAWTNTEVDADASFTSPPSLALDASGGVHLLYLGPLSRALRHAYKPAGGAFSVYTLVDGIDQIMFKDLSVDPAGAVHATYRRNEQLVYLEAPKTGNDLTFFNFLKAGNGIGEAAKVVTDVKGGAHVVMESNAQVEVGYRCPGPCPAQSCNGVNAECGLAYDGCNYIDCGECSDPVLCGAGGEPNVCCVPKTCEMLGLACGGATDGCGQPVDCGGCELGSICGVPTANQCGCSPGKWGPSFASGAFESNFANDLVVDSQGAPHVVFAGLNPDRLVYSTYQNGAWQAAPVDDLPDAVYTPFDIGLAIDPQGGLHAAYSVILQSGNWIRYATRPAGSDQWTTEPLTKVGDGNVPLTPIFADAQGNLHVAYHDADPNTIVHAERPAAGGAWIKTTIAPAGNNLLGGGFGEHTALFVDSAGGVHVTCSLTNFNVSLMYAYRAPGGSFVTEPIAAPSSMFPWTSLFVDPQGGVHVAGAVSNSSATYLYKPAGGAWSNHFVGSGAYCESDIVVDAAGAIHISYNNDQNGVKDMRYARRLAGELTFTTFAVDTAGNVGVNNHLFLEPNGRLHVTYLDATLHAMKHAFRCLD